MKILAVDYGDSRTGLATCDHTEFLTTTISVTSFLYWIYYILLATTVTTLV